MKKSLSFKGAETYYDVDGVGTPVLLLHGFGESSEVWRNVKPSLVDYKLILPDLPGSGNSQEFPQEKVLISDFAEWILAILAQENIETIHFIGHSMGGYVAMEFASRYPDKLNSIGLFHSSAFADDAEKIETRKKSIDFIKSQSASAFLKTSIPALFKEPDLHEGTIAQLVGQGGSFSAKSLVQYYKAMIKRKDHSGLLSTIGVPALFIMGEHDKAVPFDISLQQSYLPAISFVHILRNSAHMGMYEEPDKTALILMDFLKEVKRVK